MKTQCEISSLREMQAKILSIREKYAAMYNISKLGIISDPGKFEAEKPYVPYFWDLYLEGCADVDDGDIIKFHLSQHDKECFPELQHRVWVRLRQDAQGFITEI